MILVYRPGTSMLHRMPAGAKVLLLAVFALTITLAASSVWVLPVGAGVVVAGYLLAGFGPRVIVGQILAVRWIVLIMLVTQVIFLPLVVAVTNTGRVLTVIVLAGLISLTTRIPDLLDTTEHVLGPLRRFGADPAAVGLLLAMTITAIPVITGFAAEIREAQRARGARIRLTTFVVPLLVMSLKHADDLADAVLARGIE